MKKPQASLNTSRAKRRSVSRGFPRKLPDIDYALREPNLSRISIFFSTALLSIQHPCQLLAKTPEHPSLGEVDGIDGNAQFACNLCRRSAAHDGLPTCFPGGRLKLRLHELQSTDGQLLLKL